MKTNLTPAQHLILQRAFELLSQAKPQDIKEVINNLDGYDARIRTIRDFRKSIASCIEQLTDNITLEQQYCIEEEDYESALKCLAQVYSVNSYQDHQLVVDDSHAIKLAEEIIHEIGGIDNPETYELAEKLLTERFLDL